MVKVYDASFKLLKQASMFLVIYLFFSISNAYANDGCTWSLNITSPGNNSKYSYSSSGISLTVNTTTSVIPDPGVTCVGGPLDIRYFLDGNLVSDIFNGSHMYSCGMTGIGVGNHTIYAQWGAGSIVSSTINIVVNPPPTSISLSVNSTSFTMPASIIMTANASVNGYGSVGSVAFYADGNLLFTSYSSPYQYTWSGATPGNHSLTATVYNTDGATSSTPSINVAVYMPPNFVAFNNQCSKK